MKKRFIIIAIGLLLFNTGCSTTSTKKDASVATPKPSASTEADKLSTPSPEENGLITASPEIINKKFDYKDVFKLIKLTKKEVEEILGTGFEEVATGPEGSMMGYNYEDIGINLAFYNFGDGVERVEFIYLFGDANVNGAKSGMNFSEIKSKMGDTPVKNAFVETPENKAYKLEYEIDNCILSFMSYQLDGEDSFVSIRENLSRHMTPEPLVSNKLDKPISQPIEVPLVLDGIQINNRQGTQKYMAFKKDNEVMINTEIVKEFAEVSAVKEGNTAAYDIKFGSVTIGVVENDRNYKLLPAGTKKELKATAGIYKGSSDYSSFFVPASILEQETGMKVKLEDDYLEVNTSYVYNFINDSSNITGKGVHDTFAVKKGAWIYYSNPNDDFKLYKMNISGNIKRKVKDTYNVGELNVSDGCIYFLAAGAKSNLYRVGRDDKGLDIVGEDFITYMRISGSWIYYVVNDNGEKYNLYKMKTDGNERTFLLEVDYWNFNNLNVQDGWIYFKASDDGKRGIYKIKTDGSGKTLINEGEHYDINVIGKWIYFSDADDGGHIHKILLDGSRDTTINDDRSYELNIDGEWVFYCPSFIEETGVYKIRTDGSQKTRLSEDNATSINIIDDWIYYQTCHTKNGHINGLYKMKKDGSQRVEIEVLKSQD